MCTSRANTIDGEALEAAGIMAGGGIILYPTDTIWGIGCDATNEQAVQSVYRLKDRADSKSMLVLMHGVEMLREYLSEIPAQALDIIRHARRPTTVIYPGARNFAPGLLAEDGSVGIRVTADPFCISLIKCFGKPIVSTSANISGEKAPAHFGEISSRIIRGVDHLVNWRQEDRTAASPSSIVKVETDGSLTVIRP